MDSRRSMLGFRSERPERWPPLATAALYKVGRRLSMLCVLRASNHAE
jgi:hypothetical protein